MDSRHEKKAYLGLAAWVLSPFVLMLLGVAIIELSLPDRKTDAVMGGAALVSFLIAPYFAFFWGGSHLAKAKGYSNAILVPGILGVCVQAIILGVLLFALPDKLPASSPRRHGEHRHRDDSPVARVVRHRRNAFVCNLFGLMGILLAVLLLVLPIRLPVTLDSRRLIALCVFVPGYAAVIFGCSHWVKAKNWPDATVLIGLLPLVVLFIPFVRLIYRFVPLLLPAGMVFMPIIMIAVIAVLPDKSGVPKRKLWDW